MHGHQEGRFFHGYYDGYCYLPLYVFCGRHLLVSKLRRSNIDGLRFVSEIGRLVVQIRRQWPRTRILLRADSGFCREELMVWCEANKVDYLFGLARNARLVAEIAPELATAEGRSHAHRQTCPAASGTSPGRPSTAGAGRARVVGKAEWTCSESNPRFGRDLAPA